MIKQVGFDLHVPTTPTLRHRQSGGQRFSRHILLWQTALSLTLATVLSLPVHAQVAIPSSTTTVQLQLLSPGASAFQAAAGTVVNVNSGSGIVGDNSQNWQLTNFGMIQTASGGGGFGAVQLNSAMPNALQIDNYGSIVSTASPGNAVLGVNLLNGGTLNNHTGASISSASFFGILVQGSQGTISNDGAISGDVGGIRLGGGGSVTQSQTGTISSNAGPGVLNEGGALTIVNAGSISSTLTPAILARGTTTGTIANSGTILGSVGVQLQTNGVALNNTGTITGTGGTAVSISGNNNTLTLGTGSVLNGNAVVNSGSGNSLVLQGSGSEDSNFTGFSSLTMSGNSWLLSGNVTTTGASAAATTVEAGMLTLTGTLINSGSGGGTTIHPGATLQIGNGGTTGGVTGNIVDNGNVTFNRSDTVTYAGIVSGSGSLTQAGVGTLILSSDNTYGGGTTVNSGATLQIGNGGTSGSVTGTIVDNGNVTFNRSDTATYAGIVSGSGTLTQAGAGILTLTGDSTYSGGTTVNPGATLQLGNGGTSGSVTGNIVDNGNVTFNRSDTATYGGAISGNGSMTKLGAGTLVLSGANTYSGATFVETGTLAAGGTNVISAASTYTVAANAAVDLKGYDQTVKSLSNDGLVTLGGKPGTVLAMTGGYTGNNGTIALNTVLGTDSSVTDLVKVGGDTQGTSTLKVTNIDGNGAATVNGIKVIDIAGASNATFALAGDYIFQGQQAIVAGAYGYRLYKNGVTTPTDGDWYLRSSLTNPVTPPFVPPVVDPLYQPGVPLYEAYAQTLLGLNGLPTLQQRVGNRYWMGAGNAAIAQGDGPGTPEAEPLPSDGGTTRVDGRAIWTRIEAAHINAEPKDSTSRTDYKYDIWKLQSGVDGKLYESDAGTLIGGITVHYGNVSADIASVYGTGTIDTDAYGFGGTLTWYGQNGFYVDGQAQATWFDSDLKSDTAARTMADGNNGFGYAFSLEAGQRIAINQNWTLTPQAQLSYSAVDFDSFTDPFRARISLDSGDSLKGRLGLAANYQNAWADKSGKMTRTNVYGIANLYYEFLDGTQVDVSATKFVSGNERFWGGIGAGGSYNWADDKYSIYGEVSVNTSLANFGDSYSLNGTTGFRIKW